jgi:hypothetical protein
MVPLAQYTDTTNMSFTATFDKEKTEYEIRKKRERIGKVTRDCILIWY